MLVVSVGCPSGIGPEISVAVAASSSRRELVLVGELATLRAAGEVVGVTAARFVSYGGRTRRDQIEVLDPGVSLSRNDRRPGRPSKHAGAAQLAWIDAALSLVLKSPGSALVTGPVSKAAIARSGAPGAARFLGHTEHLERGTRAAYSVMCFHTRRFSTSLVTTHLPVSAVPRAITQERVERSIVELARFLHQLGVEKPKLAVASLNPHAGESELLGTEERRAIVPGISSARTTLRRRAQIEGPIGAETAYRRAAKGGFDGVVAMMHDQATIPTKLVAFGEAVNVTLGLPIVRTSVDHGTAYDIAWQGKADPAGMAAALRLASRLVRG